MYEDKENDEVVRVWRIVILLYDDPELLSLTEFWEYVNLPRYTSLSFESSPSMHVGKVEVGSAHRNCKFLKKETMWVITAGTLLMSNAFLVQSPLALLML